MQSSNTEMDTELEWLLAQGECYLITAAHRVHTEEDPVKIKGDNSTKLRRARELCFELAPTVSGAIIKIL